MADRNNPGSQQSNTDPPPGKNRGSENDDPIGRIGWPCYVLDVYHRMNDGMVHETKIDSNPGGSSDDDDNGVYDDELKMMYGVDFKTIVLNHQVLVRRLCPSHLFPVFYVLGHRA